MSNCSDFSGMCWPRFTPEGTQLVVAASYAGAIHRGDLRAIRARLKTMNLGWDWPEFAAPPGRISFPQRPGPLQVQVVGAKPATNATNVSGAQP